MTSSTPLTGVILVDCARANASGGVAIAAERCGYGTDTAKFQAALKSACSDMNVTIDGLSDLDDEQSQWHPESGIEVSPDSMSDL